MSTILNDKFIYFKETVIDSVDSVEDVPQMTDDSEARSLRMQAANLKEALQVALAAGELSTKKRELAVKRARERLDLAKAAFLAKSRKCNSLDHRAMSMAETLKHLRNETKVLRSHYVDESALAARLEGELLYEIDRADEFDVMLQSDLNKQSKSISNARSLLGEGIEEYKDNRREANQMDKTEESLMQSVKACTHAQVESLKNLHLSIRDHVRQASHNCVDVLKSRERKHISDMHEAIVYMSKNEFTTLLL